MTLLEYAQYYVNEIGWSVIPIEHQGKKALVSWKHYQQRKPSDEELGKWFHRQDRNLAVITGEVSGNLLVLDFDRIDLYLKWFNQHRLETLICRTGKGVHVYFTLLDGPVKNGKFYVNGRHAGEIRYNGGYVLIPPSIHPNGSRYRWVRHTVLSIRFNQLHLQRTPVARTTSKNVWPSVPEDSHCQTLSGRIRNPRRYAEAALESECRKVRTTPEGNRNNQLYQSALKLAKYIGMISQGQIEVWLSNAACDAGLDVLPAARTIQSGLKYGVENGVLS